MALDIQDLKEQCNITSSSENWLLERKLAAATAFIERQLGYALDDADELPNGPPADLEEAILMYAAHLYENREATLVGVAATALPMGVEEIVANYRRYTFGHVEEAANG